MSDDTGLTTGGLILFVICWALCGLGLGLDQTLDWLGFPILAVPLIGFAGLAYHFYGAS